MTTTTRETTPGTTTETATATGGGTATAVQVHRVYIRASAQAIWDAITRPEWTVQYFYGSRADYDLRPGGAYRSLGVGGQGDDPVVDGQVIAVDPPRKLVQTWHALFAPDLAAEPPTRLTFEIAEGEGGVSTLTVTHELGGAPMTAAVVAGDVEEAGGGWAYILSGLKTLLETGTPLGI